MHVILFYEMVMTSSKNSQVKGFWGSTFMKRKKSNIVPKQSKAPVHTTPEKSSGQFLGLIVMSHWLGEVWICIQGGLFGFLLSLFHSENRICLSRGVQVSSAAWRAAVRIMAGVGDLVQRTGNDHTGQVLGGRAIKRSAGAVCGLHHARGDE
jgi:hypothetical protein